MNPAEIEELKIKQQEYESKVRKKGRTVRQYFKKVELSITAAVKMLNHAHFGQPKEVMGLLQGTFREEGTNTSNEYGVFYVSDVIALPVEASETRVTADEETQGLMAIYSEWIQKIGANNIMGWYHSHPSYGCWLSGIDVATSHRHQMVNDPFLAIVVDPIKSINFQKLDIGAFRVHSAKDHEQQVGKKQDVPRRKAVDFGYHCHKYYEIPIELIVNKTGKKSLENLQKIQWSSELANSNFFSQIEYLTEAVCEEKEDINEYFLLIQEKVSLQEMKQKKKSTIKKVSYYAQQRNISLIDSGIKTVLF